MALKVETFKVTVSTAGVAVPLSSTRLLTEAFVIYALDSNAGTIYVGSQSSANSTTGLPLAAGRSNAKEAKANTRGKLQQFDLKLFYINASQNNQSVIVEYLTEE